MILSRRAFLAAAAAAPVGCSRRTDTAAPPAPPAPPVPATGRIALGVIGTGRIGRAHTEGFLNRFGTVVAVCDVVAERRDHAKDMSERFYAEQRKSWTFTGVTAYPDYRDLLEHRGLDAVLITTPDHWHATQAIAAARAGKHIYCEKPLTQNLAEGRAIVDAVTKAGVIFQTGSQQRTEFGGKFRRAVECVWAGRIGALKTIRIGVGGPPRPCDLPAQEVPPGTDWDAWLGPAPERGYHEVLCPRGVHNHFPAWRDYREYSGGPLADLGAHHFDIVQWVLRADASGPVEIIPPADPAQGKGLRFRYAGGVEVIHNEFAAGPDGRELKAECVFEGTAGTILVNRKELVGIPAGVLEGFDKDVPPAADHKQSWLDCVAAGAPACPAEVGHRSASVCHLANIGYKLGRKLTWDAAAERFVGDAPADRELAREPRAKWRV